MSETESDIVHSGASWKNPGASSLVLLFILGLSFAVIIVFNRIAADNLIPFIPYVFWQTLGGFLILFVLTLFFDGMPVNQSWSHVRIYVLTGILNLTVPYLIFAFVASKVPSGILSLGLSLIPVTTYGLALLFRLDAFRAIRFFGIILGLAGVLCVILPETSLPTREMTIWVILGFAAPLCYALNTVCVAMLRPASGTSIQLAAGLMLMGSVSMLVVMFFNNDWWFFDGDFNSGHWATIAAMFNNALAFYLIFELIKRAGPVFFSMVNYLSTLVGLGLGIWIFGDANSGWIWFALLLIGGSLVLVNIIKK